MKANHNLNDSISKFYKKILANLTAERSHLNKMKKCWNTLLYNLNDSIEENIHENKLITSIILKDFGKSFNQCSTKRCIKAILKSLQTVKNKRF